MREGIFVSLLINSVSFMYGHFFIQRPTESCKLTKWTMWQLNKHLIIFLLEYGCGYSVNRPALREVCQCTGFITSVTLYAPQLKKRSYQEMSFSQQSYGMSYVWCTLWMECRGVVSQVVKENLVVLPAHSGDDSLIHLSFYILPNSP